MEGATAGSCRCAWATSWNPLTGEKAMIVESAEETGGARVVTDFAVEAGGFVPSGEHVHDHLAEHWSGTASRGCTPAAGARPSSSPRSAAR
jgi:hypothetical protein